MFRSKVSNKNMINEEADDKTVDMTASSSSEGSPGSVMPNIGDFSLDKDVDKKTLLQELYDLKLRIYYMEQREKMFNDVENGEDIYQKYMIMKDEYERLLLNMDEKDDLLLKAQKVTTYLREEKEKLNYECAERDKYYKERIQQLEKELEEMKLCNPKFGLHSTMFSLGDAGDSFSVLTASEKKRLTELENEVLSLNKELDTLRANNNQLDQTVNALQRKINIFNKENAELSNELKMIQKERDMAVETCAKNSELMNKIEKEKQLLEKKLSKTEEELERVNAKSANSVEEQNLPEQTQPVMDKGAAGIIRQLLTENKQINRQLRKLKEEQLQTLELCSSCTNCQREKILKKSSVLNLRQKPSSVSTSEVKNVRRV